MRAFFAKRNVIEVDTPILNPAAQIDRYIDPIQTECGYLHTSPEHGMKRLLAAGSPDIYQICHVFRKGETGPLHNPEFTMIEWYQKNITFEKHIEENLALISLFLPNLPTLQMTYADAFEKYLSLNPFKDDLPAVPFDSTDRDEILNYLWAEKIEPAFPKDSLTIITDFPATQAALSKLKPDGLTAYRFEVYSRGIELANGYNELSNSTEQRARYLSQNALRKNPLPLDEPFITSIDQLPQCCGTALGFDRLLALQTEATSVASVIPLLQVTTAAQ